MLESSTPNLNHREKGVVLSNSAYISGLGLRGPVIPLIASDKKETNEK